MRSCAAATCLALANGAAHAATDLTPLPLEKLLEMRVVAASSYEQSVIEAPSAVSVITSEDIRNHGYRTLAEALASLPGLYVTDDLSYSYLGSRGFNRIGDYNSRFQLSVNGMRTNDALFDMAYLGTEFPLDMALIERIEFAPGPGSSIYGSNAMLGVINIVTKRAASLLGPRVAATIGSDHERELAASFGHAFENGAEVLVSVSGLRSAGQDFYFPELDAPGTNSGIAAGQNGERFQRSYLRATYGGFDLEILNGRRDKTTPSVYLGGDFLRADNRVVDSIGFAVLRYRRDLAESTALEAKLSAGRYDYTGDYWSSDAPDFTDRASARWYGGELRVVSSLLAGHKLVAGVELQQDARLDQQSSDANAVYLDRHDTGRRVGAYVQDEVRLAHGWLLNAGLRLDRYESFGSSANPRVALIGEVASNTTLKLLYGSAFRAPNAYELYYITPPDASQATLAPERSRSTEVVLEHESNSRTRWRASLFHYRFDDLIEQTGVDGGFVFHNRGEATGRGVELSGTTLLPAHARLDASATFSDARDAGGERLTNAPRYTARLGLVAPLAESGVKAALDVTAVGPRLDIAREEVRANVLANLVFTTRSWNGVAFSLGIHNLADRRNMQPVNDYFVPRQVPGMGRSIRLVAEWRY